MTIRTLALSLLASACLSATGRTAEPEKYLPADTSLVVSLNVRQLLGSPLIRKYAEPEMRKALARDAQGQKLLQELGLDPFTDVDRITLAAGPDAREQYAVVVRGKFDARKLADKAAAYAAEQPQQLKVLTADGRQFYEISSPGQRKTMYAVIVDGTTIVGGSSQAQLQGVLAGTGPAKAEVQALLRNADESATLYAAAHTPDTLGKLRLPAEYANASASLDRVDAITARVGVANDVRVEINLQARDEGAARDVGVLTDKGLEQGKQLAQIFLQQPDQRPLLDLINSMASAVRGQTVTVAGELSGPAIDKAMQK